MYVLNETELNDLKQKRIELRAKIKTLYVSNGKSISEYRNAKAELRKLSSSIKKGQTKKRKELYISEHSVLRYLERGKGINIASIKKEMVSADTRLLIKKFGDGKYPIKGTKLKLTVVNNCIVSVY